MKTLRHSILILLAVLYIIACNSDKTNETVAAFPAVWLEELTISQLQQGYREGKYTVRQVVADYLARIEAIDNKGPELNSVICANPEAIQIAEEIDKAVAEGKTMGPLFGVPVLLKDNIDTHDKMPNTAGSRALMNSYPAKDSPVAAKLREAGAVIIGKANLSEWANFR